MRPLAVVAIVGIVTVAAIAAISFVAIAAFDTRGAFSDGVGLALAVIDAAGRRGCGRGRRRAEKAREDEHAVAAAAAAAVADARAAAAAGPGEAVAGRVHLRAPRLAQADEDAPRLARGEEGLHKVHNARASELDLFNVESNTFEARLEQAK